MSKRPTVDAAPILLVEDSSDDIFFMQEAIAEARLPNNLQIARDGTEAMSLLRKKGANKNAETPVAILLDLHMPKKDGFQVLRELEADPILRKIPTIVMSGSALDINLLKSYGLHPDAYIKKPVDARKLLDSVIAPAYLKSA